MSLSSKSDREKLPLSIQQLVDWINSEKEMTPRKITMLVQKARITAEDLLPWTDYDHPITDSYGRLLVHDGGSYEMLVMSWVPGDFSTIHDHGYTEWGTVQVFGPAEHATFSTRDGKISTIKRWNLQPGEVIPVSHGLVHQMGNRTNERYLTFHLYGNFNLQERITGDSRLFDLHSGEIQLTDNGVFFMLAEEHVNDRKDGYKPDFPTWLRHEVELYRRVNRMVSSDPDNREWQQMKEEVIQQLFDASQWDQFKEELMEHIDESAGKVTDSRYRDILITELQNAAEIQESMQEVKSDDSDTVTSYADLYNDLIRKMSLKTFMKKYFS